MKKAEQKFSFDNKGQITLIKKLVLRIISPPLEGILVCMIVTNSVSTYKKYTTDGLPLDLMVAAHK